MAGETSERGRKVKNMSRIGYRLPIYGASHPWPPLEPPKACPPPQAAAPQPPSEHSENTGDKLRAAIREIAAAGKVNRISTRNVLLALISAKVNRGRHCGVAISRVATCVDRRRVAWQPARWRRSPPGVRRTHTRFQKRPVSVENLNLRQVMALATARTASRNGSVVSGPPARRWWPRASVSGGFAEACSSEKGLVVSRSLRAARLRNIFRGVEKRALGRAG